MSGRELERVEAMGRVQSGDLPLKDAAAILALSYGQTKRVWRGYRERGAGGLKRGKAGRESNRGQARKLRRRVLRLIRKKYSGADEQRFGPTLAAEHLAEEDGIVLDHETLRRWMLEEGWWSRRRKGKPHFGELVQLDGSFHDWREERGPRGCVMNMVDDATATTQARMGKDRLIKKLRRRGLSSYQAANMDPPQSKAPVCEYQDGAREVYYRGERIRFHEIAAPIAEVPERREPAVDMRRAKQAKPGHPWRLGYEMRKKNSTTGDTSNELIEGTFLKSFDSPVTLR